MQSLEGYVLDGTRGPAGEYLLVTKASSRKAETIILKDPEKTTTLPTTLCVTTQHDAQHDKISLQDLRELLAATPGGSTSSSPSASPDADAMLQNQILGYKQD